jgi:ribonuclease E
VSVATYLINEKREWLRTLEDKSEAELIIVPNENIQTPEYSIKRVRDDEMELPEQRQATYLMPTAPEVAEPVTQDRKPPQEPAAVAPLMPSTSAPASVSPAPDDAAAAAAFGTHGGFWSRFKRMLSGEPVTAPASEQAPPQTSTAPAPRSARRDEGHRREGRREHSRHTRHADGARRDRDGRRDGRDRDRSRDHGDRDRSRDRSRRHESGTDRGGERSSERSGERAAERGGERASERVAERSGNGDRAQPSDSPGLESTGPVQGATPSSESRAERPEGRTRGRRGRRRGRRGGGGGGGGVRESAAPADANNLTAPDTSATPAPNTAPTGNGRHDAPPLQAEMHEPAAESRSEAPEPAAREYHAEPRDPGPQHESTPIAHFEPSPKPETSGSQSKPYVVWSSAPPQKDGGNRGPEE